MAFVDRIGLLDPGCGGTFCGFGPYSRSISLET